MKDVGDSDTIEEVVDDIQASIDRAISSELNDTTASEYAKKVIIEKIEEMFIIKDSQTEEEYDGSGFPIEGKFVLFNPNHNINKELNFQTLSEAIEYLYDVAEKEYEWLSLLNKELDETKVFNDYFILNTKNGRSYSNLA